MLSSYFLTYKEPSSAAFIFNFNFILLFSNLRLRNTGIYQLLIDIGKTPLFSFSVSWQWKQDLPGMSHIVFCLNFEDNLQDFPKWHFLFIQQLEHKDRTLFWLQIQQLYQVMLWHCYHRQVAKEHRQSKYLSKLTSSLHSLQSGRRKGIQPLRDVKMKEKKGCCVC